ALLADALAPDASPPQPELLRQIGIDARRDIDRPGDAEGGADQEGHDQDDPAPHFASGFSGAGAGGVCSGVSSSPFLNSLMALPSERDSSGSFLAPKKKTPIASAINRSWVPIMAVLLRPHGCSRVVAVDHGVIALDRSGGRWSTNGGCGERDGALGPRRHRRDMTEAHGV